MDVDLSLLSPPLWIELTAVVAGALAGAVFGATRGLDAVGIVALAVVGGLGGGVLRDVLLGTIPMALDTRISLHCGRIRPHWDVLRLVGRSPAVGLAGVDTIALGLFTLIAYPARCCSICRRSRRSCLG